jgi:UDP-N-acetylmuramate dehydrogenase
MSALERELRGRFGERVQLNRPLADLTSFRIGGPADLFLIVEDTDELSHALAAAHRHSVACFFLGSGTNLLVSDRGVRGLAIKLGARFARIAIDGIAVSAGAAAQFSELAERTVESGLAGLEFGEGIPGSVGGGLVMNAGAFGGEMASVVRKVRGADETGAPQILSPAAIGFAYRRTTLPARFIITQVDFGLTVGDRETLRARVADIRAKRARRQPDGVPNAGSVFKNPPGGFAGKLLEEAGLKGERLGRAAFSEQHANFIVNLGGAHAAEVRALMDLARDRVRAQAGISLEPEVRLVGEW